MTHVGMAPPLIKLMGYEHREYAVGGGESRQWQTHTHPVSPVIPKVDKARSMIGRNLDTSKRGHPTN